MKKLLLSFAVALVAQAGAVAQTSYTFSKSTGTYADLTGATVVSSPAWEASSATFNIPIGFNFMLDGQTFSAIEADGWGDLYFTSATAEKAFFAIDAPMIDKGFPSTSNSLSPVSYLLSGTAGSRILKIEYKNAGIVTPSSTPGGTPTVNPSDVANLQIWLYEGSNRIEVRYGTISVANIPAVFFGVGGPSVAVVTSNSSTGFSGQFLSGTAAAPTLTTLNGSATYPGITGIPASGTIFTFNVSNSGVTKTLENLAIAVYPNPVTESLKFTGLTAGKNATVKIYDALGKVVKTEEISANTVVNVSALKNGTYFVEINSAAGRTGKQIIKQ